MKKNLLRGALIVALSAATIGATSAAASATTDRAHWAFDEPGTPPTAFDSSGNNNNGTNENIVGTGTGYAFNGTSSRVVVNDSPSLSPGTANFSFAVTVITDTPAPKTDYDVLRKGLASTVGGEYKVEIVNAGGVAKAFCLVKDSTKKVASIRGGPATGIADGIAHTITCTKDSTGVTIQVDSMKSHKKTVTGTLGSVANSGQLTIGAKADAGGDWFSGTVLDARVS